MNVKEHISELIGNTPMLRLRAFEPSESVKIYAKLELFNPGGSVKDRVGQYMIEQAEKMGLLKPGDTIVEATAGNTGLGIALAALDKPYQVILTVPEKFSKEKIELMQALGATVVLTPKEAGMQGAIEQAEVIRQELGNAISLKQFENPANPETHYLTTGPEIYDDLDGQLDILVAGAGSGGTVSGIAKYLKKRNPRIKTYVAEPLGSTMGGGEAGCYAIEGIGNHFIPQTMDMSVVDAFMSVSDEEAFEMVKALAKKTGIIAGSSSGAALAVAVRTAKTIEAGTIVVVLPDRGDRYFSKGLFETA